MAEHSGEHGETPDLVRTRDFDTDRPLDLDITHAAGTVTIELTDTTQTHVEVRHAQDTGEFDWRAGMAGLLSWVSERFTEAGATGAPPFTEPEGQPVESAVRQTRVELTGNRLVIKAPNAAPLRGVPLAITVRAPSESHIGLRTGSGSVTVTGTAGRVNIQASMGAVSVDRVTGKATVRSGSGALRLGSLEAEAHARSGNGDIEIASITGSSTVNTGSGDVWLGEVDGNVLVRTGSGNVTVSNAATGDTEVISGSGELRISVRQGTYAEIDLSSTTGTAMSELDVSDTPPNTETPLRIHARTGSGDAVLTSAAA